MKILASYFAFPARVPDGWHNHLEYHPGDEWIAETSIPTVISVKRASKLKDIFKSKDWSHCELFFCLQTPCLAQQ